MPRYTITENQPLTINFEELLNDRAWVLNDSTATHFPCNINNPIRIKDYEILPNTNYTVSFRILEMSDSPQLRVGFTTTLFTYTTVQDVTITVKVILAPPEPLIDLL